jgi:hypothetical protein
MYEIDEKFLNETLRDQSRSIVGRLCKRIEILENENIPQNKKSKILKDFQRELVYESYRDLKNILKAHATGVSYNKYKVGIPLSANDRPV